MNIAVTADGATLNCTVFKEFSQAPYLLIINVDTMDCTPYEHEIAEGSGKKLAQIILENRCEAVITGKLEKESFDLLADDGVTRYGAEGKGVEEALKLMDERQLPFIRNHEGTDTCGGSHHHDHS